MSMYQFVRGPRLFIQAARENADPDAVNQNVDDEIFEYGRNFGGAADPEIQRVHTQRMFKTESHGSASSSSRVSRKGGLKSITRRIIRKTTTLTRGEQRVVSETSTQTAGKGAHSSRTVLVQGPWGAEPNGVSNGRKTEQNGGASHSKGTQMTQGSQSYSNIETQTTTSHLAQNGSSQWKYRDNEVNNTNKVKMGIDRKFVGIAGL